MKSMASRNEEIIDCFKWLGEKQKELTNEKNRLISEERKLSQAIRNKEHEKGQLQKKLEMLQEKKKRMDERMTADTKKFPDKLIEKHKHIIRSTADCQALKWFHTELIKIMLKHLQDDLKDLLQCSKSPDDDTKMDTRDVYKVYGLLLSGCDFRKKAPNIKKIFQAMQNSQRETAEVKDCIEKAVTLTKDMLMLLPPFVVTVNPKINNERLHDINRSTWDTKGSSKELIYYRPILVYGNQLHVAVKGLVGNVEKGLSTHHTRQLHKQESLPSDGQEHPPIHQREGYCAECKGPCKVMPGHA